MFTPSATKQFVISGPTSPSDITDISIPVTLPAGGGTGQLHAQKYGKLYFNIFLVAASGGSYAMFDDNGTTNDVVASLLGETRNAGYDPFTQSYGALVISYNGTSWTTESPSNSNRPLMTCFLAN